MFDKQAGLSKTKKTATIKVKHSLKCIFFYLIPHAL